MTQTCDLEHNHEISADIFNLIYPKNRKLDENDLADLKEDLKIGASPKLVREKFSEKTGKVILMKDLNNIKSTIVTSNDELPKKITELGSKFAAENDCNTFEILVDENGELDAIFIQSKFGKQLFAENGYYFQMDGTYSTNMEKFSLYLILTQDKTCVGRIIAACLLRNEDCVSIGTFLELFKKYNNTSCLQTAIVDKDASEIKALTDSFPSINIVLCYFHNIQNIEKALKSETPLKKFQITNLFKAMSKNTSFEKFNAYLDEIKAIATPKFVEYFEKNWLSCKQSWAGYSDYVCNTNGTNTNARIEAKNRSLKQLLSRTDKLDVFLTKFFIILKQDKTESTYKFWNEKLTVTRDMCHNSLLEYIRQNYASKIFEKCSTECVQQSLEYKENEEIFEFFAEDGVEEKYDASVIFNANIRVDLLIYYKKQECSCTFFRSYKMPCRHIFQLVDEELIKFTNISNTFLLETNRVIFPDQKRKKVSKIKKQYFFVDLLY